MSEKRNQIISKLVEGAYKAAFKRERNRETAKEWAQEAILKSMVEFDRYAHLPDNEIIKILGRICINCILEQQRREVEKDKREIISDEEFTPRINKVLDDGHYEPFLHHRKDHIEPNIYPSDEWDGQIEHLLSKELLEVLKIKCNGRDEQTFIDAKMRNEMILDKDIFPNKSKASISRIKSRIRETILKFGY